MELYIKYKRLTKEFTHDEDIQEFLDELSSEGWDIIHYNEKPKDTTTLNIVVVAGKRQSNVL